jgi:hypothetical protein
MKTRNLVLSLVVAVIALGGFAYKPTPAKAIKNFTVTVSPKVVGKIASFRFQFTLEKTIEVHQWFEISFPKGTTLTPPIPEIEKDRERKERLKEITDAISFNIPCTACMGLPIIEFPEDGTMTIKFHTPAEFDPADESNNPMVITIQDTAGIVNPTEPGSYTYKIRNQQEPEYVESQPVEFAQYESKNSYLWLSNPVLGETTGLTLFIPIQQSKTLCFELTLQCDSSLNFGPYLVKNEALDEEKQKFVYDNIFYQGKPLSSYKLEDYGMEFGQRTDSILLSIVLNQTTLNNIQLSFSKELLIKCIRNGISRMNGDLFVFYYADGAWKSNTYQLQFNENYIFPKVL